MDFLKMAKGVAIGACASMTTLSLQAAELSIASGAVGRDIQELKENVKTFEELTGHKVEITAMPPSTSDQFQQFSLWLSQGNKDIDVYRTDIVWAPQLATHLIDLSPYAKDVIGDHFPSIVESQTVDGRLVALPIFTDAGALYYRKDLLEKYALTPPKTWEELRESATKIQEGERKDGNPDFWGFVFQGAAYEGLMCDALEWIKSNGGGQIVEADGTISINNEKAAESIDLIASFVKTISPEGVLSYKEEDARGVWQLGNAAFMRNWPYAFSLSNGDDSAIKGKFDVVPLPVGENGTASAATLGGWNVAVSKYSEEKEASIELVKFLASADVQRKRAINNSRLPTIRSLYDDPKIIESQPIVARWKSIFDIAVPRPSAPVKADYNRVSTVVFSEVNAAIAGEQSGQEAVENIEEQLEEIGDDGWLK